ncbi:DeoR/GlpR family DNA-binding transcription regulator [Zafaria sp. Z1313]|uniref:DeoR/GlpR family DNA-binding transcription regulator n=1 Tax=unclassified Zafaria TaxID=2828765 RepID=UPI002E77CB2F|nr:DeoR/GlpR family DNA-binding transcription regulator [Zafaria sp. J156]MEE1621597.1 DeoR/GlpR family DNA-binding transcription regulator [Zafaria sp. J156]
MLAEERHRLITAMVARDGQVTVAALSEEFGITRETARRDLALLEQQGTVRRVHGGAVPAAQASTAEESLSRRTTLRHSEKQRIAARALELIPAGAASVAIDAGTTTELLAQLLAETATGPRAAELLVITHAVPIAYRISSAAEIALEVLGGRVRGLTSAAVGDQVLDRLDQLRPDIAFVGTNGLDAGFGLSTPDPLEASVKSAIVRGARRVVVLADSSKLGVETLVRFAGLEDIDTLVTDAEPPAALAEALAAADVDVVLA